MFAKEIKYIGKTEYEIKGNLYSIPVAFRTRNNVTSTRYANCIFDTGCTVTTLTLETCKKLGIDKYKPIRNIGINGVVGNSGFDLIEVPIVIFGCRMFKNVKIARYMEEGGYNLLGLNILEHLKYYVDTEEKEIYFLKNLKPNVPERYKSEGVFYLNPEDDKEESSISSLSSLNILANRTEEPKA